MVSAKGASLAEASPATHLRKASYAVQYMVSAKGASLAEASPATHLRNTSRAAQYVCRCSDMRQICAGHVSPFGNAVELTLPHA